MRGGSIDYGRIEDPLDPLAKSAGRLAPIDSKRPDGLQHILGSNLGNLTPPQLRAIVVA